MQPAQARRGEPGPPPLKAHPLALGGAGATAGEQRFCIRLELQKQ